MSVIGFLSVAPVKEGGMSEDVAQAVAALDSYDVEYQTTPMGTIIETDDIETLLDAVGAAHNAVDADRVSTFLKVDDRRDVDRRADEKVASVEEHLGREASSARGE